jgi:chromosome segregation ATPase
MTSKSTKLQACDLLLGLKRTIAALNAEIEALKRRIRELESMLGQEKITISRKMTEYEARINSQTFEIQNLKSENTRQQSMLHSYQSSRSTTSSGQELLLRAEVDGLKKDLDNSRTELLQKDAFIQSERRISEKLRGELQALKDEFSERERKSFSEQSSVLQSQSNRFQEQIEAYQKEIKRMNDQLIASQSSSFPQNEQLITLNKQIHELNEKLITAESLQRSANDKVNFEKDQNRLLTEQIGHFKEQLANSNGNAEKFENQSSLLKDQIRGLKDQLKDSQQEAESSKNLVNRLQEQIDSLRQQSIKQEGSTSGKSENNTNASSKTVIERNFITQMEHPGYNPHLHAMNTAYIQETEAELARLRNQIMRLQSELSKQQSMAPGEFNEYQGRIHKLRLDLEQAQDQALQESRKSSEYKKALELSEHEHIEQIKQTEHYKSESQELKWKLERADQQISQLQRELKASQEDKERSRSFNEQETKLKAQIEILMKDLHYKEEKIEKLTMNFANLTSKFSDISENSSKKDYNTRDDEATLLIKEENDNLKRINNRLLMELNELRSENNSLRAPSRNSYGHQGREYQELSQKLMFLESKFASEKENGSFIFNIRKDEFP